MWHTRDRGQGLAPGPQKHSVIIHSPETKTINRLKLVEYNLTHVSVCTLHVTVSVLQLLLHETGQDLKCMLNAKDSGNQANTQNWGTYCSAATVIPACEALSVCYRLRYCPCFTLLSPAACCSSHFLSRPGCPSRGRQQRGGGLEVWLKGVKKGHKEEWHSHIRNIWSSFETQNPGRKEDTRSPAPTWMLVCTPVNKQHKKLILN